MKASNMGYSTMRLMWIVLAYTNFAMRSKCFFWTVETAPSSVRRDSALSTVHTIVYQTPHHFPCCSATGYRVLCRRERLDSWYLRGMRNC